jgi:hypothetical protein
MGENNGTLFNIYLEYYNHRKRNFQKSPAPIGRRYQPHVYRLQLEGIYNSLNSPAPIGRRLQPPSL